ncbi:hypothetical protein V8F06_014493, partial [Rhypophila decipiens]
FPLKPTAFSEVFEPECRLLANPLFWWLTTLCGLAIACCLSGMIHFQRSMPLVTIGDAVDSFLDKPSEQITRSACSYDHTSFRNMFRPKLVPKSYHQHGARRRWWQAVGLTRWGFTTLWFLAIILALITCFMVGVQNNGRRTDPKSYMKQMYESHRRFEKPLQEADQASLSLGSRPTSGPDQRKLKLVTIANTPQFITSLTYLYYNMVVTLMVAEREWHRIGSGDKRSTSSYLRVSNPRGRQRGSDFLSLPYRYAIPLMAITIAEKWLASVGVFYFNLDLWDTEGRRVTLGEDRQLDGSISTLGYSALAVFWMIILTAVSWMAIVLLAIIRRYPPGKPLMGTCTGVIAASCHFSTVDRVKQQVFGEDIAAGALSWGVIRQVSQDGEVEQWLGFRSGKKAEMPVDGQIYG